MHPCKSAQKLVCVKFNFRHGHLLAIADIMAVNLIGVLWIVVHYEIQIVPVALIISNAIVIIPRFYDEIVRI